MISPSEIFEVLSAYLFRLISGDALIVVVTVDILLSGFGSNVEVKPDAMLVRIVPLASSAMVAVSVRV